MRIDEVTQKNPNLVYLSRQPAIAWDFLGTLVDGPADHELQKFIKKHPEIKHYVITTLSEGGWLTPYVIKNLKYKDVKLTEKNFAGIIGANEYLYYTGMKDVKRRREAIRNGEPDEPMTFEEEYVKYYKENMCKQLGVNVLVDDDIDNRHETCRKFGIKLINPEDCL